MPRSGAPRGAENHRRGPERDGTRLQIRTPGDLETLELTACDRVPPGPGQIEVAVTASSINFADVLVAMGLFPSIDDCGDIAEPGTAQRLVATATATGLPVRGVLHAAAVVEDATLTNITDDVLERDWAPKVDGAWNLHRALQATTVDQPLDWFCSFSSAAALVGSPGQGAYAAANSWLDAFTGWRRAPGRPATAIAWVRGPRSGAPPPWRRAPTLLSLPRRARMRSTRCCAATAATPGMRR